MFIAIVLALFPKSILLNAFKMVEGDGCCCLSKGTQRKKVGLLSSQVLSYLQLVFLGVGYLKEETGGVLWPALVLLRSSHGNHSIRLKNLSTTPREILPATRPISHSHCWVTITATTVCFTCLWFATERELGSR